jgi:hypothetical protein
MLAIRRTAEPGRSTPRPRPLTRTAGVSASQVRALLHMKTWRTPRRLRQHGSRTARAEVPAAGPPPGAAVVDIRGGHGIGTTVSVGVHALCQPGLRTARLSTRLPDTAVAGSGRPTPTAEVRPSVPMALL